MARCRQTGEGSRSFEADREGAAEGDYVIAHGRFTGSGRPAAWIAADIVRFEDGKLAEHWDVLQDEATRAESVSGLPMFGNHFPA
jgi:predicted SnoaL-like aldol condensation-catalyzing enzyme